LPEYQGSQNKQHTHGSKSLTGAFEARRSGSDAAGDVVAGAEGIINYIAKGGISLTTACSVVAVNYKRDRLTLNATHEHNSNGGDTSKPATVAFMWILRFI